MSGFDWGPNLGAGEGKSGVYHVNILWQRTER
jgi:hypothetical protein